MLTDPAIKKITMKKSEAVKFLEHKKKKIRESAIESEPPSKPARPRRRASGWSSALFNYALVVVAIIGLVFSIHIVKTSSRPIPVAQPFVQPSRPPYRYYIAGAGIVEAASENIQISTPIPGMVTEIPVTIGQQVNAGDLLFKIDTRDLDSELLVREAALDVAKAKIPEAQSNVDDAQQMYDSYKSVIDTHAVTKEEFNRRKFGLVGAQSRLLQAIADVASAKAQIAQTKADIARRTITAPVTGEVLQLKIHLGEYAQVGPLATPLMVLGETKTLHIRTDIDENDAWRFSDKADAVAYVRGNPKLSTPLTFVHVEPYVVPKASLTGGAGERVDTRVLQVLFGFDPGKLNVFVGQQMDVYIEVRDHAHAATTLPTSAPSTLP